jgi:hypothetical protein
MAVGVYNSRQEIDRVLELAGAWVAREGTRR